MPAHTGNKYAEKWTYEKTMDRLCAIEHSSQNDNCLYIGQALDTTGLYTDIWRYWQRKWKKRPEIIQLMKRIMQRFEVRLFGKMAKKEIPANVAMFALRHHYEWGRVPDPKGQGDALDYVDHELIEAPHTPEVEQASQPAAEKSSQQQMIAAPTTAAKTTVTTTPATVPVKKESLPPMEELLARAASENRSQRKLAAYNRLHPEAPLSNISAYFNGPPHPGLPAIPFEGGFFLTA